MTITINPPDDIARVIEREAAARGLTAEGYLLSLVKVERMRSKNYFGEPVPVPEEFSRHLEQVAQRHGDKLAGLTDEDMSRASIYENEG